jgi:tetratricopeptide (TPR) repeat protein
MPTRWIIGLLLAGTLLVPGCAKNPKPEAGAITKVSEGDAQTLNAQHARFEHSEDPPIAVETRFAAGQLAEDQHNVSTAIAQYREALKLDPHHLPSLYRLGVIYTQIGAYPDALAAWKDYVDKTDGDAAACHVDGQQSEADRRAAPGNAAPCHSDVRPGVGRDTAGRVVADGPVDSGRRFANAQPVHGGR